MFQETQFLLRSGVPYDVAMSYDDDERLAAVVVQGQFDGNKFSWEESRWLTRDEMD